MQRNINVGQATPDNVSVETSYRCQKTDFALFQKTNNKKGMMSLSGHCQAKPDLPNKQHSGFTLIELLVVVLIIGILAAVAVPQYQKAVEKSKATQALTLLKSMYQAAQAHLLASGQWPASVNDIDIEIPETLKDWRVGFQATTLTSTNRGSNNSISMIRNSGPYLGAGFIIYQDRDTLYKNNIEMERILCVEQKMPTLSLRFTGKTGDYCQKIMQGTLLDASDGNPFFKMPY